jgi:hypothetical protein
VSGGFGGTPKPYGAAQAVALVVAAAQEQEDTDGQGNDHRPGQ